MDGEHNYSVLAPNGWRL